MPSDFVFKTANTLHRVVMKATGGRIGWSAGNMPVIELTTTGRKSGQQRSTMLTAWIKGDKMAIIASAGGSEKHPAWYLNLQENPSVRVRTQTETKRMTARIAQGEERDELWNQITSEFKQYGSYQSKTDRTIPVVLLEG